MNPTQFRELIAEAKEEDNFLLYGKDDYLKSLFLRSLRKSFLDEATAGFNYTALESSDVKDASDIIDKLNTLPAFATKRMVVLRRPESLRKSIKQDLKNYKVPSTAILVLYSYEYKTDKLSFASKGKIGCKSINFPSPNQQDLIDWANEFLKDWDKKIERKALIWLTKQIIPDLILLKQEIDKLALYTMDKPGIRLDDVKLMLSEGREYSFYNFTRALQGKKSRDIGIQLAKLLSFGENGIRVIYTVAGEFIQLLQVKLLMERGKNNQQIAKQIGLNPYVTKIIMGTSKRYTGQELREIIALLLQLEMDYKKGKLTDSLIPSIITAHILK